MLTQPATWSLVLAGGDGSRLRSLTTTSTGQYVPKQYCSLLGGASLIHETIRRALAISSPAHICAVVAQQHRQWWQQALWPIAESNIVVQPQNKGTANGILFPLLHILDCDPEAKVVLFPADHHVEDELILRESILSALNSVKVYPDKIMLLGIEPDDADAELGYIVPATQTRLRPRPVSHFVEKPDIEVAQRLINAGALWNSFIIVAHAKTLLQLFIDKHQSAVLRMQIALLRQPNDRMSVINLYATLREVDFSEHILPGMEPRLRVIQVRKCGWSDLGTPKNVLKTLHRTPREQWGSAGHAHLSIALQHEQQQRVVIERMQQAAM